MFLQLKGLKKIYEEEKGLKNLDLEIEEGSFVTLLGPSGCGKTTTLNLLGGFIQPDSGHILLEGEDITGLPPERRPVSTVFQSYALFPHLNVLDNVCYGLRFFRGMKKKEAAPIAMEELKTVGLSGYETARIGELSDGQQQRVALARAMATGPKILLLDEPLSNLDAGLRVQLREELKELQKKLGITMVFVTHDQEEALAVSDRIAVMNGGVIQQIDTPKNVYQRPSNIFVSTFIGLSNIMDGRIEARDGQTLLHIGDYSVPMENLSRSAQDGQAVKVSIRPEEFIISREDSGGIPAVVRSSVFLGITTHYFVETADGREMEVIQNSDIWDIIPDHTPIRLGVQPHKINVFTEDGSQSLIVRRDHS